MFGLHIEVYACMWQGFSEAMRGLVKLGLISEEENSMLHPSGPDLTWVCYDLSPTSSWVHYDLCDASSQQYVFMYLLHSHMCIFNMFI